MFNSILGMASQIQKGRLKQQSDIDRWFFSSDSVLVFFDFNTDSARTFFALANFKFYFVTLARRLSLNFRYMEKQITPAIASDETKMFFSIKKLYSACIHYHNLFRENLSSLLAHFVINPYRLYP